MMGGIAHKHRPIASNRRRRRFAFDKVNSGIRDLLVPFLVCDLDDDGRFVSRRIPFQIWYLCGPVERRIL